MPDGNRTDRPDGGPESSPREKRERVQLFLAKYHGFTTAVVDDDIVPTRLAGSIRAAHPGISVAHGQVQDALNSGQYDQTLADSSLADAQLDPKERGYLHNMNRYYAAKRNHPTDSDERAVWAARALRWGNIIVGSLSSELDKVKGVEFIKEGGEVLVNAVEEYIMRAYSDDEDRRPPSAAAPPAEPDDDYGEQAAVETSEYAKDQPKPPAARRGRQTQPRGGGGRKTR
jgi:hypothetical protein